MPKGEAWKTAPQSGTHSIPPIPTGDVKPEVLATLSPDLRNPYLHARFHHKLAELNGQYYNKDGVAEKMNTLMRITSPFDGATTETSVETPITGEALTLINPERVVPSMFKSSMRGAAPEVNELTGDLRWRSEDGRFFGSITPVVEMKNEVKIPISVDRWTIANVKGVLAASSQSLIKEHSLQDVEVKAMEKIASSIEISDRTWRNMDAASKETYVKGKLKSMIEWAFEARTGQEVDNSGLIDQNIDGYMLEFGPSTKKGEYAVGIAVKEYDEKGKEQDSFTIYLEEKPSQLPQGLRHLDPSSRWMIKVVCGHGDTAYYDWGRNFTGEHPQVLIRKPVIYVYPTQTQKVEVRLNLVNGTVTTEYPQRTNGAWTVIADPDGKLVVDGKSYPYLFWEGVPNGSYAVNFTEGFYVQGSNVVTFLEEKLKVLGLNEKEMADFITYWFPIMKKNAFSLVKFLTVEYTEKALLKVNPAPDTLIRIFMAFKAVSSNPNVVEQRLEPVARKGYTVVEWGGVNLDEKA